MQYTKLGNSDLTVSRICMGCMGFGDAGNGQHSWTVDEAQSREIIKRGLELGVNSRSWVAATAKDFRSMGTEIGRHSAASRAAPQRVAVGIYFQLLSVIENKADCPCQILTSRLCTGTVNQSESIVAFL